MQQMTIHRRGEIVQSGDAVTIQFEVQSVVSNSITAAVLIDACVTYKTVGAWSEACLEQMGRDALLAVLDPA